MPDRKPVMSHRGRGKMYYFGGVEEGGGQQAPGSGSSGNVKMRVYRKTDYDRRRDHRVSAPEYKILGDNEQK